jgi:hypothetical protein
MQAAVMIHRMLWWKKGVLSLPCMQAAVMITQNALEEGVLSPAPLRSLLL